MRARLSLALLVPSLVLAASAAGLGGLAPSWLAAGAGAVGSCDGDGVGAALVVDESGRATDVVVSDVDAGCAGGELLVAVVDSLGDALGSGGPVTVPAAGGEVTVALSPQPDAVAVVEARVAVSGP